MTDLDIHSPLARAVDEFVRKDMPSPAARAKGAGQPFGTDPRWVKFRQLGSDLWLDTGSMEEAAGLWTREFTALTTNNTLLNKEIQKGTYDQLVKQAAEMLSGYNLSPAELRLELAFILNAHHGLRLVERFDAYVSVEEHTDLANDVASAVAYARRFHAICPERFIVKLPFTPAGLLATRRLSADGIAINHTLGFSARQNYLIARIGRPAYVNVFMGRLNIFAEENGLAKANRIGQRATIASQAAVRGLRQSHGVPTRQIAASFRTGGQVHDVAGVDVLTIPPAAAREFLAQVATPGDITDRTDTDYDPGLADGVTPRTAAIDTLWRIDQKMVDCVDALEREDLDAMTPDGLLTFFADHGCGDLLVRWTDQQIATSRAEGKSPKLANWGKLLERGTIGLDSLMNLAGLYSFAADQKAMDDRAAGAHNSSLGIA